MVSIRRLAVSAAALAFSSTLVNGQSNQCLRAFGATTSERLTIQKVTAERAKWADKYACASS